jgi:leader peptidase (prepilin peptidase)/N-methyltransferase
VVQAALSPSGFSALASGRCASCGLRFGPPFATVELTVAAAFASLALVTREPLPLLAYCWLATIGTVLSIVDVAVHRLPDRLTASLGAGVFAALSIEAAASHAGSRLLEAMTASAASSAFYLLMWAVTSGGMGLGDAKLALGLGLAVGWNGWAAIFAAVTLGLLLTGLAATALLALGRAGRKDPIPHGPFMVLGSIAVLVVVHHM